MTVRSLDREEIGWHNITVLAMEMSTSLCPAKSPAYQVISVCTMKILIKNRIKPFFGDVCGTRLLSTSLYNVGYVASELD